MQVKISHAVSQYLAGKFKKTSILLNLNIFSGDKIEKSITCTFNAKLTLNISGNAV